MSVPLNDLLATARVVTLPLATRFRGITTREAQTLVRLLGGVDKAGADLVEVSPPFDVGSITALTAATLMFELLCVIADGASVRRLAAGSQTHLA